MADRKSLGRKLYDKLTCQLTEEELAYFSEKAWREYQEKQAAKEAERRKPQPCPVCGRWTCPCVYTPPR